jgi:hypothetical protein
MNLRYYFSIFTCILFAAHLQAQPLSSNLKRSTGSIYFFANVGGIYHLNQGDLILQYGDVQIKNTLGAKASIEAVIQPRKRVFMNVGLEFRTAPQRMSATYDLAEFGHTGADRYKTQTWQTNAYSVGFKISPGYSFPVGTNSIDAGMGLLIDATVQANKMIKAEGLYVQNTTTGYNEMVSYYSVGWGQRRDEKRMINQDMGFNTLLYLQAAYRLRSLLGKHDMRFGFDATGLLSGNRVTKTAVNYFDKNRNLLGTNYTTDRGVSLGFFVGISI